jgi:Flp pilus assembly protein TadD
VTRNKNYPDAYVFLADALIAQNKVAEAIERLEAGAKNAVEDPGLWVALGQAYYRAGRYSEARQQLEKAAAKDASGPAGRRALELLRNFPR